MSVVRYFVVWFVIGLFATVSEADSRTGFQGGLAVGNASLSPVSASGARKSFNAGLIFDYELNKFVSLQLEPMYVEKGLELQAGGVVPPFLTRFTGPGVFKLNYVHIPITAKFLLITRYVMPFFFAGPYFAFNVNSKFIDNAGVESSPTITTMDFGLDLGAGLNFKMTPATWFFLALRYSMGLIDSVDSGTVQIKHRVWMFNAGFLFL